MNPRHPIRSVEQGDPAPEDVESGTHGDEGRTAVEEDGTVGEQDMWIDAEVVSASPARASMRDRLIPAAAIILISAWTGLFITANLPQITSEVSAAEVVTLLQGWVLPVILIAVAWLLLMRSSTREARRYGNVAASLERQTVLLEERLATINRELGLARDFLSAEVRELEFLGRSATERIGEHAGTLQALIQQNGAQVDAIANVSSTALENMNRLRQELPVIAASARDMSNQIGNVGRSASEQIGLLSADFDRMREAGHANESQIEVLRTEANETLSFISGSVDELASQASGRLSDLQLRTEEFRHTMLVQEEEALASIKTRATRLGSELSAFYARLGEAEDAQLARVEERLAESREQITRIHDEIGARVQEADESGRQRLEGLRDHLTSLLSEIEQLEREADAGSTRRMDALRENLHQVDTALAQRIANFDQGLADRRGSWDKAEAAALSRLAERLDELDGKLSVHREQQVAQTLMLAENSEEIAGRIAAAAAQVSEIVSETEGAQGRVAAATNDLTTRLAEARELIDESDEALASVLASGEQVQALLQNSLLPTGGELQSTLSGAVARIEQADRHSRALAQIITDVGAQAGEVENTFLTVSSLGQAAAADAEQFSGRALANAERQSSALNQLHADLAALEEKAQTTAQQVQQALQTTAVAIRDDLAAALEEHAASGDAALAGLAEKIGAQSAQAIDAALNESGLKIADDMADRMREAADAGRGAVVQLRDQLARIHELTSNLEARIARAREQSEENVDNDFSRRVALITERLNSTAIDLDNLLSVEVSETAWATYLKGDRGIFTRKVLKLLTRKEAKEIAELYGSDSEFREHTNRYLHDFEAMLRSLLSTRNGNALGVLILSSDMGKLYVALAQAIERLRT